MEITPKLDLLVIDCPDALALGRFYADDPRLGDGGRRRPALGHAGPARRRHHPRQPRRADDAGFQRIDDWVEPTWPGGAHPQQMHLDLATPDMDASEEAVLAAGARKHDHQPSTNGGFRVFLDPAGHPFCLIRG